MRDPNGCHMQVQTKRAALFWPIVSRGSAACSMGRLLIDTQLPVVVVAAEMSNRAHHFVVNIEVDTDLEWLPRYSM